jgi:hypothetical protein
MEEVYDTTALVSDDAKLKEEEEEKKIQKMKCDDGDGDDEKNTFAIQNLPVISSSRVGRDVLEKTVRKTRQHREFRRFTSESETRYIHEFRERRRESERIRGVLQESFH